MKNDQQKSVTDDRKSPFDQKWSILSPGRISTCEGMFSKITLPMTGPSQKMTIEEVSEEKCSPISAITSHSTLQGSGTDDPGLIDFNFVIGCVVFDGKERQEPMIQAEQSNETMKTSLIDELDQLAQEDNLSININSDNKLQLFECVQAYSEESDSEEDHLQQDSLLLVNNKQAERGYNPIYLSVIEKKNSLFVPEMKLDLSRESSIHGDLPANKRNIIRNFFKPKTKHQSFIFDDRTCSNSMTTEQQATCHRYNKKIMTTGVKIKQKLLGKQ